MDDVSIIVTALALGAATGAKSIAEQAVKDSYHGLKNLLQRKYAHIFLDRLEHKPESKAERAALTEDLKDAGAEKDPEVILQANKLIDEIRNLPPERLPSIGVNIERLKGEELRVEDISYEKGGIGVNIGDSQVGKVEVKKVHPISTQDEDPKA